MDAPQAKFEGWAIVEMFGHQREVGFVTTDTFGTAALFRIDTPEQPEQEIVLKRPTYVGETWTPAGAKVKRAASPARTKLVGPGAIYAITPCTEETARKAMEELSHRPLILLSMPEDAKPALLPGEMETGKDYCADCGREIDDDGQCACDEEDAEAEEETIA